MSGRLDDVTAVIVNFETPAYTRAAVESLLRFYPTLELIVVDNGSRDGSADCVAEIAERTNVSALLNHRNRRHGPALDQGVRAASTTYALTLDSDTEVFKQGFLEAALALFDDPDLYAVGELRYKSKHGLTFGYDPEAATGRRTRIPYIHPWAMVIDRVKYPTLSPFLDHGAPAIRNMQDAKTRGYRVQHFPMSDFIIHHGSGTLGVSGWGVAGRIKVVRDHALNRIEGHLFREPTIDARRRRRHRKGRTG